jgi:hypothetical protein
MKTFILSAALVLSAITGYAQQGTIHTAVTLPLFDSVKLRVEGNDAYYQQTIKVDSNIRLSSIYTRTLEFMATKNFQQNYGYEQEGKLIFTTTQDLNQNINTGDDDNPQPYTAQFSIVIDMKNGRYRYTIRNVIFYLPTDYGNRRLTLYEVYQKENPDQPRRVIKDAKQLIASFERYLIALNTELYTEIEHKAGIYNPKF